MKKPNAKEVAEIAKFLSVSNRNSAQFFMGFDVEWEHAHTVGYDPILIGEIVLDHLTEDPKYYTKLRKIHTERKNPAGAPKYFTGRAAVCAVCSRHLSEKGIVAVDDVYEVGIMYACPCGKARVFTNRIRNAKDFLQHAEKDTLDKYYQGFCSDLFDGFAFRPLRVLQNGVDVPGMQQRADLVGNQHTAILVWFDKFLPVGSGEKRLAKWFYAHADKIELLLAVPNLKQPLRANGANQRFLRRVPMSGRSRKYRYVYDPKRVFNIKADPVVGEKVRVLDGAQPGHYLVTDVKDDKVFVEHDETGRKMTLAKKRLYDMLRDSLPAAQDTAVKKVQEKYSKKERLPASRLAVYEAIKQASGIDDYDYSRADARYLAWKKDKKSNKKPPPIEDGHLDSFKGYRAKADKNFSAPFEAFEAAMRGIKTWRDARPVVALLRAVPGFEKARLPDDAEDVLRDTDVAVRSREETPMLDSKKYGRTRKPKAKEPEPKVEAPSEKRKAGTRLRKKQRAPEEEILEDLPDWVTEDDLPEPSDDDLRAIEDIEDEGFWGDVDSF